MRNFIKDGDCLDFVAPAGGVASGEGFVVGNLFAVATTTAAANEAVVGCIEGVFELPKRLTTTFASGGMVSWDISAKRCDAPGTGRYPIGAAVSPAGNTADTVVVRLDATTTTAAS